MSALRDLLASYRSASKTEREKGTYFELLIKDFLKHDPTYSPNFSDVWTYAEWAESQGIEKHDVGIDLVAKLAEEDGYCAIQCKFYDENHRIQKSDLDSFFTASGKKGFARRYIVDSTRRDWSEHAENALRNQAIDTHRIGLADLENSPVDWSIYSPGKSVKLQAKKTLREHQTDALKAVKEGLSQADRGKLIMACGTGKTFTSLKIAESLAGGGKQVLFLVPSLSLMSQTITEWTIESAIPLRSFAVCSDTQVGKRKRNDDLADINIHDLAYPATTDAKKLAEKIAHSSDEEMTVIFSTYQSIQVIADAQKKYELPAFDLIVCDEAHRTTGATLEGEDESYFVRIHDQDFIAGNKRLYMTATPRIFGDAIKTKAREVDATLASMDNPDQYGETLYELSFSYAVQKELLTDYKVLVLAVDETMVNNSTQKRLSDPNSELILDDASKIIGCYRALSKIDVKADVVADPSPMRRAVAFCRDIKSSKGVTNEFKLVIDEYLNHQPLPEGETPLTCEIDHVDGTYNATARNGLLSWLKEDAAKDTCRILSNARCLSEGVDVPALDAILFLHPRKSQIDVVQSVGRVMRRAKGKNMGYVILPIGVPAGVPADEALNNNEKYKIIWQILNALRSHDDRFDATINKIELGVDASDRIEIIAVSNTLPDKKKNNKEGNNIGGDGHDKGDDGSHNDGKATEQPTQTAFEFDDFQRAIYAKIVKKCGKRDYWENWANDIARIAQTHITRITALLENKESKEYKSFTAFLEELRDDLNESISDQEAIEMLAQHIITKPVFDALFEGYSFTQHNPVSIALQNILDVLQEQHLEKETETLNKFYESVRMRAAGIENAEGKQRIVVQLYDKFFRNAFPKMTDRLGIVYTPVEVVDFIIHSVNKVLHSEFNQTLADRNVHIIDPFTGTGTFITRLLQSGLIGKEKLPYKYQNEIHANEIVLLAYYIATINIEAVYHGIMGGEYLPFNGICLTDTFQLHEKDDLVSQMLEANSNRRKRQKELKDIRVIMGNPPYSAGQTSANDNNANIAYANLDESIRTTYAAHSSATNKNALYDSYIRAIRWASNRIEDTGVIGFVTNAGFIEANTADGMRKCLAEEFTSIYVFHLRGNQRTSGELSRKEGGKIFGSGSRAPIAITIMVKNPQAAEHGRIFIHDIGDYLSRDEKLARISKFKSISGISNTNSWLPVTPDKHHDWVNQRDSGFDEFISLGNKKDKNAVVVFANYSRGLETNRDAWCYNYSKKTIEKNMHRMIDFYNHEVRRYKAACTGLKKEEFPRINDFINADPTKISWNRSLKADLGRKKTFSFNPDCLIHGVYRPFSKQWAYFHQNLNAYVNQMPRIFPDATVENRVICVTGKGETVGFSALMVDELPNLHTIASGQCFPFKLYEKKSQLNKAVQPNDTLDGLLDDVEGDSFSEEQITENETEYTVKDGITDAGLAHFEAAYPNETITKEDVFYYIYGLLHSEDYRKRYADNLSKELPRIPCVKKAADFWIFSKAGRDLAKLHINYESVEPYPVMTNVGDMFTDILEDKDYRVEKMKFGKKGKNIDKTTVIYNHKITMSNIPLEAFDYIVNGKPALEWVMERQAVTTDKNSGIGNDANLWAIETMHDPAYPLKLFQRVITVSLETLKIVKELPRLDILQ
ncbi:type ISP restriction/modification enzyme [Nitrosomonas sp.]|uniref:DEAD/DEAH box helicase n=1 Tax=Nitrosomonas sp. TaxID=42353 RepID=UPI00208A1060|nr:type ISP restriction/modification enzyme [Nitrosomonas sp.]GJL73971.1 MAG: DNA damage-inducible protein [Nitrosomonas sp.]